MKKTTITLAVWTTWLAAFALALSPFPGGAQQGGVPMSIPTLEPAGAPAGNSIPTLDSAAAQPAVAPVAPAAPAAIPAPPGQSAAAVTSPSIAVAPGAPLSPLGALYAIPAIVKLIISGNLPKLTLSGDPNAVSLQNQDLRRLLGDEVDFVYDHGDRRDPMLLPWTHYRYMAKQRLNEAERAFKSPELANYLEIAELTFNDVLRIVARMEISGYRLQAMPGIAQTANKGLEKVAAERKRLSDAIIQLEILSGERAALPIWVKENTIGIIYSPVNPMCLVGPHVLKVGDRVPIQNVDIIVERIEKMAVTYRVSGKSFRINLEEGE